MRHGLMQMCLQVLPLLLVHDTSIDLFVVIPGLGFITPTAQPLWQPGKIPLAGGKSAATITHADGTASLCTPAPETI